MKNDEFKDLRRKAWSEIFNYLCFDMARKKIKDKFCIFKENKKNIECIPESETF